MKHEPNQKLKRVFLDYSSILDHAEQAIFQEPTHRGRIKLLQDKIGLSPSDAAKALVGARQRLAQREGEIDRGGEREEIRERLFGLHQAALNRVRHGRLGEYQDPDFKAAIEALKVVIEMDGLRREPSQRDPIMVPASPDNIAQAKALLEEENEDEQEPEDPNHFPREPKEA